MTLGWQGEGDNRRPTGCLERKGQRVQRALGKARPLVMSARAKAHLRSESANSE
jgi:hypothetical protein